MSKLILALTGSAFILLLTGVLIYFSYNNTAEYQQPNKSYYSGQPAPDENLQSWQTLESQETLFRQNMTKSFQQTDKESKDQQMLQQQQREQEKAQRSLDKFKREQESLQLKRQSGF